MIPSAVSSALQGIRAQLQMVTRSAEGIARSGLGEPNTAQVEPHSAQRPPHGPPVPALELEEALVQMRIAQRAYTAQLRVLQTADEMSEAAIQLPERSESDR